MGRVLFLPLKALLAIWFKLIVPVACHFLDRYAREDHFTVGYHVLATLAQRASNSKTGQALAIYASEPGGTAVRATERTLA